MKRFILHIFLLIFIFECISVNALKAEGTHSYTMSNDELFNGLFNKENFANEYYNKVEQKRKSEEQCLKQLFSKRKVTKPEFNTVEIENYIKEHKRLESEAIHKLFDERLDFAVRELNKLIKRNDELMKAGRASKTDFLVDLREEVNNFPFLKPDKRKAITDSLIKKNVALQKKFKDDKVKFYVLLNLVYPENNWVSYQKDGRTFYKTIESEETDKYLKQYTEELCRMSDLTSKGILLNVESVVSHNNLQNKHYLKNPVYIATGKDLKNSEKRSLHELIQLTTQEAPKKLPFELAGQEPDSDPAFEHRATVLSYYVYQLPSLLLGYTTDENLVNVEEYKYNVKLSHLTDEEKRQIKIILNTVPSSKQPNTFTAFRGTGLKDYAGMQDFLQKFLVSDLSTWKSQNSSANLKIITTSNNRLSNGKDARDLLYSETLEPKDFIVAMHFMEENGDIMVHWDAQWDQGLKFLAEEKDLAGLWTEITSLTNNEIVQKYFEEGIEGLDFGFSQLTVFIGSISDVIKDNRIPEEWYKWSNTTAFLSGMINGILDDLSGAVGFAKLGLQFVAAQTALPYKLALFAYKYAFNENVRKTVDETLTLICVNRENTVRVFNNFLGKLVEGGWMVAQKCWSGIKEYGSSLIQFDYKSYYQYGYTIEQVASLLIGVAEVSEIAKGAKFSAVLLASANNLIKSVQGLIVGIGQLMTKSVEAGAKVIKTIVLDLAEYGKLLADNFGSFLDDLYFASIKAYKSIFYKNPNDYNGLVLAYASDYSFRYMNEVDKLPYESFKDFIRKMSNYLGKNAEEFASKIDPSDFDNIGKAKTSKALYEKNLDNIKRIGNKSQFDKLSSKVPDPDKLGQVLDKLQGIQMDKITGIMNNVPANKVDDLITSGLLDQIKARSNLADDLAGNSELAQNISKLIDDPKLVNTWEKLFKEGNSVSEALRQKLQVLDWVNRQGNSISQTALDDLISNLNGKRIESTFEDAQGRLVALAHSTGATRVVATVEKTASGEIKSFKYTQAYNKANQAGRPPLSKNGLTPDFSGNKAWLYPVTGNQKNIVRIKLTGKRAGTGGDFHESNKLAGFTGIEAPVGPNGEKYTWHHLDDFDPVTGESTMQLVGREEHRGALPHTGSVKQYENYTGKTYDEQIEDLTGNTYDE